MSPFVWHEPVDISGHPPSVLALTCSAGLLRDIA